METTFFSAQEIQITSVQFREALSGSHELESYPRRMVYEGREVSFIETGMRYLIKKGAELIKLFDVSDGETQYRLRLDGQNHWTLIGKKVLA
jgi:hypothetical protein